MIRKRVVAMLSAQGTACAETALIGADDTPENRRRAEEDAAQSTLYAGADRPVPGSWTEVSDNDAIT